MTTLWRQVLAALTDDTLDDAERETIVARGAAQLAVRRAPEGQQATPDAVLDTAFREFNLLLTPEQARAALREVGRARGSRTGGARAAMGVDRRYGWHAADLRDVPRAAALGLGPAAPVLLERVQVGLVPAIPPQRPRAGPDGRPHDRTRAHLPEVRPPPRARLLHPL